MAFALPPLKQTPSPNWSERVPATIDLVVIHSCEGNYPGSISWFAQPKSQVSAHLVLNDDGSECTQMVPLRKKAWHVCSFNSRSIGVEMSGFSAKGFAPSELNADANIVAWLLKRFNIPCQDALGGKRPGFTSHYALGAAGGGHVDPTRDPTIWAAYASRVTAAYMSLPSPLPAWALDDAPSHLMMLTAPMAMPEGFVATTDVRSDEGAIPPPPPWPAPGSPFFGLAARCMNKWLALGAPWIAAIGMVANGQAECGFNVTLVGDHDRAFGLQQWWWNPRGAAILAATGIDVRHDPLLEHHVEAAWWEITNRYPKVWADACAATSVNDAAQLICRGYEGASALYADVRRGMMADAWDVYFKANPSILTDNPPQG
jgi:hypothetical protein